MRSAIVLLILVVPTAQVLAQAGSIVSTDPRVRVETSAGDFVIALNPNRAPLTTNAFLTNVTTGFYAGTVFHRVVSGFIAQGGGYTPDLEIKPTENAVINESGNGLSNLRGTVGMARTGEPHSATTQFYVNLADNLDLNPRPTRWGYAVFGTIVEGMDVVDEIGHAPTGAGGEFERSVPVNPIIIENVVLLIE